MNNMNLIPVYPEIFLLIASCAILLIDMFLSDAKRHVTYTLSILTLLVCGVLTFASMNDGATSYTFHNMFVSDPMSDLLKLCSSIRGSARYAEWQFGWRILCVGPVCAARADGDDFRK